VKQKEEFLLRACIIETVGGKGSRRGRGLRGGRYQLVQQLGGPGLASAKGE
jgi:hypothetical protein